MVSATRHVLADEELGKKDNDYKLRSDKQHSWRPQQWRLLSRPPLRRLLLIVAAAYLVYMFFKNMPTDLTPARERYKYGVAQSRPKNLQSPSPISAPAVVPQNVPPPRDESMAVNRDDLYYDGNVIFNALGESLLRFREPSNRYLVRHPVVFAASSLESVSDLLPLACGMADRTKSNVHFVLMGRNDVSIEGILHVNGIHDGECPIHWHGRLHIYQACDI